MRELERQKGSLLFERLCMSKDKKAVIRLASVGLILCEDKKEAVVRYTLPKQNNQIFASKYKLYLPSEEDLKRELKNSMKE